MRSTTSVLPAIVYDDSGGVVQQRDGAIFTSVESCEQAGKARLSMILLASTSVALIALGLAQVVWPQATWCAVTARGMDEAAKRPVT